MSVTLARLNESMSCPAKDARLALEPAVPSEENVAHIVRPSELVHALKKLIPKESPCPAVKEVVPRLPHPPVLSKLEL